MTVAVRSSVALVLGLGFVAGAAAQTGNGLAFRRAEHLRRGINLSMWYAQTSDHTAAHYETYTTAADFTLIKSLGFDHVRLSIDPEPLIAEAQTGALKPEMIAKLDKTIGQLLNAGLNVDLDIHPEEAWKATIVKGDEGQAQFYAFWTTFAQHFAGTDPERVFFEVMNEPTTQDLKRWQGVQLRAVERIRRVAPQHTVIVTASNYSSIDSLVALDRMHDDDLIYTFHFYTPFLFTHQGANWATQEEVYLRGIPYPSTPENVQPAIGQVPDERAKLSLERYGWDRWSAPRIGAEFAAVADWAQRRGIALYLGEFGVYRKYAKPEARDTWISDVRTAAESKHIGWCMWDYQADFGLVTKGAGGTVVDEGVARALGLKK